MSLLPPRARSASRQARALATLDDILTEDGGSTLPPLRWTVEPNASLTGHVPPQGSEGEIRALFDAWTEQVGTRRLAEFGAGDRTELRSILAKFGIFHVYLTIQATVPDALRAIA